MNADELTGQARTHVVEVPELACRLHRHAVVAFLNLRRAALSAGLDLRPASAFRDFARQLALWNGKFNGEQPLYDGAGQLLDVTHMAARERVAAILHWSALPGASRHHWGTDVDIIDANAIAPGYRVQLTAAEFAPDGPFFVLGAWLETHAERYGFFRPYRGVLSGVRPEPWHFSFAPLAEPARRALTPAVLESALAGSTLAGREEVLAHLGDLHQRYVAAIDWP